MNVRLVGGGGEGVVEAPEADIDIPGALNLGSCRVCPNFKILREWLFPFKALSRIPNLID